MPSFLSEPDLSCEQQNKIAVLLLNLGTPDTPTVAAIKPYLRSFLSDKRVVELPKLFWLPILYGLVLPRRSKRNVSGYQKIWLSEGSPLSVYTKKQAALLAERFPDITVCYAMSYGNPSIPQVLRTLKKQGVSKVLALPLYPQYAASCTGAALDKVFGELLRQRNQMSVRTVSRFYNDAGYIEAMKQHIEAYWLQNGRGDKLMLSFHGIPQYSSDKGDPYVYECHHTARLLAEALSIGENSYVVSFQSRFGKAKWVEPSTQKLLQDLAVQGTVNLDVFCPGFVSDCLETMEEIAIIGREQFYAAGGRQYRYIPCLNTHSVWIEALAALIRRNLQGWQ